MGRQLSETARFMNIEVSEPDISQNFDANVHSNLLYGPTIAAMAA
jgi:hypothetical protein